MALALWAGPAAAPGGLQSAEDVIACSQRNIPETSSVQTVEFTAVDRLGSERVSRSKIYGKKFASDGLRRVLLRFTQPLNLRGSALLAIELEDRSPDTFIYTPELRKVKRVSGHGAGGNLFGTDFSYEDFARWQQLNQPGTSVQLPAATEAGRSVYVLETTPAESAKSAYERIVTFFDQETCVALKTESFEAGDTPRKVLTANPERVILESEIWIATELLMRDIRDETHTRVLVDDIELDHPLKDSAFSIGRLSSRRN